MVSLASWILWPVLLSLSTFATYWGWTIDRATLVFNLTYVALAGVLFLLERRLPYRQDWLQSDGQEKIDLGHTVLTKGVVQAIVHMAAISGLSEVTVGLGASGIWPSSWPLFAQVLLGLAVAEFGLYWAHRLAHTTTFLWRFHAVHHSVERLWFWNTGRFHLGDTMVSLAVGTALLFLVGAPREVLLLTSTTTAYIGILTHCNIKLRCGWLNYIFNTPELHRWHHSFDITEGNHNFGESLMVFDHLFGTFYWPREREVGRLGIADHMPPSFRAQLLAPFTWRRLQSPPQNLPH